MWILKPLEPGGETHYLLHSKVYVVGRKNCDILLSNDQSISRAHAHLTADEQTLTLKDSSKYGTFVNNNRLPENQPLILKPGDNVTFGVFHSKFRLDCQKIVVCSSCLDNNGKVLLSQALQPLGGRLVNAWTQDCTHLVMPSVKVTIKTICALLCCRPIVTQEFFTELSNALRQNVPPPQAERFLPEIDEPSLNNEDIDLGTKPERKRLFSRRTFVFFNAKQLKRLSAAVSFGGGESHLLEEGPLPQRLLESPLSCVVDVATGNSQPQLSSSTVDWVNSVRKLLQEKGSRLIAESEIGLAAIHVSCEKYCNPFNPLNNLLSVQSIKPNLPSASLSQNATVEETVLQAPFLNVTAYAVNTESSQRMETNPVAGMTVGETPEKRPNGNTNLLGETRPKAQRTANVSPVADTMSVSLENTSSQRNRLGGGKNNNVPPPVTVKTVPQVKSSQKQKASSEGSPQKQSMLTSFFQPVNKKRPREDESSAVESQPKRVIARPSSSALPAPNAAPPSKQTNAPSTARAQNETWSGSDLFLGPSGALTDGDSSRKGEELEEDIDMEELESIMSQEMDHVDEPSLASTSRSAQLVETSSGDKRKQASKSVEEHLSTSKRLRIDPQVSAIKTNQSLKMDKPTSSIERRQLQPTSDPAADDQMSHRPSEEVLRDDRNPNAQAVKDEDVSIVVDSEPLAGADPGQTIEMLEKPLRVGAIKQSVPLVETEEELSKKLLVEFKSLIATAPPRAKPKPLQEHNTKNFKCFRKVRVPGAKALPHIIGGSDLLAHNRGMDSELEEWLKDAAEEERQNKQEESLGDDLFRYVPSKLSKRR